jgi:DNA-binding response OmpR family regulator
MRVLLLEDEPAIRQALVRSLGRWGHHVTAATTLAEARAALEAESPDAVISDLKLPDGSGLELCIASRRPFLLMSGYASFEDAVVALRHGCVDFLTKPVPMQVLKERLAALEQRCRPATTRILLTPGDFEQRAVGGTAPHSTRVQVRRAAWCAPDEAQAAWQSLLPACITPRQRQIAAELCQATPAGSLVINRTDDGWLALLEGCPDDGQDERRQVLAGLAADLRWDAHGIYAECGHGA